eukprot:TRINITY_DN732_c0_g1_i4.p1 TRINITY_DN732_c0_g1~~TRINITY_DN732_c0_g1_i4.p1  ORF type:complete len:205 (+),score=0.42 TRINITY_DN732_c0_g1_i4:640-1254(+)
MMLIPMIFCMGIIKYRQSKQVQDLFSQIESFSANEEISPKDEEALNIFKSIVNDPTLDFFVHINNWRSINGLLLRNAQTIHPVSQWHQFVELASPQAQSQIDKGGFMDFLQNNSTLLEGLLPTGGSGLFLIGNSMNHSCRPNCVVASSFPDHHIKVIALREIKKGEQLCFSYIDEEQPCSSRQQQLWDRYLFHCKCHKCKEEEK